MPTKYTKKPVTIEAIKFTGTSESFREVIDWTRGSETPAFMDTEIRNCSAEHPDGFEYPVLRINTKEGTMKADFGDYIIRGVQGEHYACKPDIFEATYEQQVRPEVDAMGGQQSVESSGYRWDPDRAAAVLGDCLWRPDEAHFRGDDRALIQNIVALLELDKAGALVPHGIGGHGRAMLAAAAVRLAGAAP